MKTGGHWNKDTEWDGSRPGFEPATEIRGVQMLQASCFYEGDCSSSSAVHEGITLQSADCSL